jgi:pimeloyl-ACP methyl ester carboxylesterase
MSIFENDLQCKPEAGLINLESQVINYLSCCNGNPAILILHGWGSSSKSWEKNIEILCKAGFDVFVPDLPGFGDSPSPLRPWEINDYVEIIFQFIKSLNIQPQILVGHSFGGRVAIRLLLNDEANYAKGLVLCASSGLKKEKTLKQKVANSVAKLGNVVFAVWPLSVVRQNARRILYRSIGEYDYYRAQGTMQETFKRVIEDDISVGIHRLKQPTLIVWGDQDKMTPIEDARRFQKLINKSRLVTVSGTGHRLPYEQPEMFCDYLLKFAGKLGVGT